MDGDEALLEVETIGTGNGDAEGPVGVVALAAAAVAGGAEVVLQADLTWEEAGEGVRLVAVHVAGAAADNRESHPLCK